MTYRVYENYPHNKAAVHQATGAYYKNGRGLHEVGINDKGHWHGPFEKVLAAQKNAKNTGRASRWDCGKWSP